MTQVNQLQSGIVTKSEILFTFIVKSHILYKASYSGKNKAELTHCEFS